MNINEIKVVNSKLQYSSVPALIKFAVDNCFSGDGVYHKYLHDYAETLAELVYFTNYTIEKESVEELYNEVMEIRHSKKWTDEILPELGEAHDDFLMYLDSEIDMMTQPLAKFDATLTSAKKLLDDFNAIVGAVGVDKLKNLDLTRLADALDGLKSGLTETNNTENNVEMDKVGATDNIVPLVQETENI